MKIDTSKISGFDELPEDVKNQLTAIDLPDPDYSGYVSKTTFDKKASEAAALSKQLSERMSEQERADAEQAKLFADMKAELDTLKREKSVASYKASFLSQGYDEKLAEAQANAMYEGKTEDFFANQKTFLENMKKAMEAEALGKQPEVSKGTPPKGSDADKALENSMRASMGLPPI